IDRVDSRHAPIAAKDRAPLVRPARIEAAQGAVILRTSEIRAAAGKRDAVIELRGAIAAIDRAPTDPRLVGAAHRAVAGSDGSTALRGAVDAAIVGDVQNLVGGAVEAGVEGEEMLVGMREGSRAIGIAPVGTAVIGAKDIDAGDPYAVSVERIDRDCEI